MEIKLIRSDEIYKKMMNSPKEKEMTFIVMK